MEYGFKAALKKFGRDITIEPDAIGGSVSTIQVHRDTPNSERHQSTN